MQRNQVDVSATKMVGRQVVMSRVDVRAWERWRDRADNEWQCCGFCSSVRSRSSHSALRLSGRPAATTWFRGPAEPPSQAHLHSAGRDVRLVGATAQRRWHTTYGTFFRMAGAVLLVHGALITIQSPS
jgi:hypothetical protein